MNILILRLDMFKEIFFACDFLTIIRFRQVCKYSYKICILLIFVALK